MATPTKPNKSRKIWTAIAVVVACAIIGIVIWRLVAGHV